MDFLYKVCSYSGNLYRNQPNIVLVPLLLLNSYTDTFQPPIYPGYQNHHYLEYTGIFSYYILLMLIYHNYVYLLFCGYQGLYYFRYIYFLLLNLLYGIVCILWFYLYFVKTNLLFPLIHITIISIQFQYPFPIFISNIIFCLNSIYYPINSKEYSSINLEIS
jgi:hypothetical protein